jgi:hypothetical protein
MAVNQMLTSAIPTGPGDLEQAQMNREQFLQGKISEAGNALVLSENSRLRTLRGYAQQGIIGHKIIKGTDYYKHANGQWFTAGQ